MPQHFPGIPRARRIFLSFSAFSPFHRTHGPVIDQAGQGWIVGKFAVVHRGGVAGWGTCLCHLWGEAALCWHMSAPEFGRSVGGLGPGRKGGSGGAKIVAPVMSYASMV